MLPGTTVIPREPWGRATLPHLLCSFPPPGSAPGGGKALRSILDTCRVSLEMGQDALDEET